MNYTEVIESRWLVGPSIKNGRARTSHFSSLCVCRCLATLFYGMSCSLVNKDDYYNILCLNFSTKCRLLMTDLVLAFVLFIFMLVLLCFCVATVSRRIKIYIQNTVGMWK